MPDTLHLGGSLSLIDVKYGQSGLESNGYVLDVIHDDRAQVATLDEVGLCLLQDAGPLLGPVE